ncbi:hypothetical protein [Nonomuraea recticatena]|uniref:Uncharacterized protein n=1 Tax=Nonomuraea recticatena TaxID=46178 RepID=A0ABN3RKZ2_9ACTN
MSVAENSPPTRPHFPSQGPPKPEPPPYARQEEAEPLGIEIEIVPLSGAEGRTLRATQASVIYELLCWFAKHDTGEENDERMGDRGQPGPV